MDEKQFNPEKADKLLSAEREQWLPVEEVLKNLAIEKHEHLADFGAGNGYFAVPMAKKTSGKVYAADIELTMLNMLRQRAEEENLQNISYLESDLNRVNLPDSSIDKGLASFVLHEVSDLKAVLKELTRVIKQDGKLLIIDWAKEETESGPPLDHRISSEDMENAISELGIEYQTCNMPKGSYGYLLSL
ncbi:methyltransferase domain-containing protein [Metabacillus sp. GX 13764]|uniref:class I SAM-dependent methyltransferase n=1 Tax=Metabacillus kandeliae TaxID=2900151 RepID=UPI001E5B01B2|nr:methyltransferase domain-containing protein [Metabacillus kandeliae]MCD7035946.1 methyltransferase domain-containing protein [Metabacillus kandeliae]